MYRKDGGIPAQVCSDNEVFLTHIWKNGNFQQECVTSVQPPVGIFVSRSFDCDFYVARDSLVGRAELEFAWCSSQNGHHTRGVRLF